MSTALKYPRLVRRSRAHGAGRIRDRKGACLAAAAALCLVTGAPVDSRLGPRLALQSAVARAADQLLFPPIGGDPLDLPSAERGGFVLTALRTPQGVHAESYDLSAWVTLGAHHAVAVGMPWMGVETPDRFLWGGGAPWVRWSSHLSAAGRGGAAFDALAIAPFGDAGLYPLTARAPSLLLRGRLAVAAGTTWRAWVGVWGRRVSPPDKHDRPRAAYPSGGGLDAYVAGSIVGIHTEVIARLDRGGLPHALWLQPVVAIPIAADLALRVGGATSLGTDAERPIDSAWSIGLQWRPTPARPPAGQPPKAP